MGGQSAPSASKPKLTDVTTRRLILLSGIGFGCFLSSFSCLFNFGGIISDSELGLRTVRETFFLASLLSTAVAFIVLYGIPHRKHLEYFERSFFTTLLMILLTARLAGTFLLGVSMPSGILLSYILGVAMGISLAVLFYFWFAIFSEFDSRMIVIIFLIAVAAVLLTSLISLFIRTLPFGTLLGTGLSSLLLVISVIALFANRSNLHPIEPNTRESSFSASKFSLFALVTSFVSQFLWVFNVRYAESSFSAGTQFGTDRILLAVFGVVLLSTIPIIWRTSRWPGFVIQALSRMIVFILILSITLTIMRDQFPFIAYTFALLSFLLVQIGIWSLLLHLRYLLDNEPLGFMGFVLGAQYLGRFLGFALFMSLTPVFVASLQKTAIVLLSCLVLVCCIFIFVFTQRDIEQISKASYTDKDTNLDIDTKCESIKKAFRLTNREGDILKLLARGRNAISIQGLLHISYGTIKTHRHNIYVKLGINSQQELLTVIEDFE
jgi:DNA-binding CsgD family transcriptional regulator